MTISDFRNSSVACQRRTASVPRSVWRVSETLNSKPTSEVALTVFVAILLLVAATGRHSYGFYIVFRLVATVGGVYWAWRVYGEGLRGWVWAFAAVALLMNPFVPIRMQRAQWQPIDLWLGMLLLGWSGYWFFRNPG